MEQSATPRVSVVVATFDRSNVLRIALESALRQDLGDLEVEVVGDACTDDSAAVVHGFEDARLRWTNLAENTGDQSGPNNEGVRRARSDLVAFLNHDDLWFPDHLSTAVAAIEATGADMVFTLGAVQQWSGRVGLTGYARDGRYSLLSYVPASTWLVRRKLLEEVGGWLPPTASREVPSQHWLARAHALGADMRMVPVLTAALIASTAAPNAYRDRRSTEQEEVARRMATDAAACRVELLTRVVLDQAGDEWPRSFRASLRRMLKDALHRKSAAFGIHPHAAAAALRFEPPGGWLDRVYERRGLGAPRGGQDARGL